MELDRERDTLFQALRIIMGQHAIANPDPALRTGAKEVLDVLVQHGIDLHRKNYQEQTAGLVSIQSTVDGEKELQKTLKNLNLWSYYQALNESNQAFDTAYLERNTEYAQMPEERIHDLRKKIEERFEGLSQRVNAFIVLEADPSSYVSLADELNALVESYQQLIERRTSGGKEQEDPVDDADLEEVELGEE